MNFSGTTTYNGRIVSDTIVIAGLTLDAIIGIHEWERQIPRPLLIDVTLHLDLRAAGASDALEDTVDYQAVADWAATLAGQENHHLIEHYAEALAQRLLLGLPVIESVDVTVHKPGAVPAARTIAVQISRGRSDYP